jgi:hypothetical protein
MYDTAADFELELMDVDADQNIVFGGKMSSGNYQYFGYQDNLGILKWQVKVDLYLSLGFL